MKKPILSVLYVGDEGGGGAFEAEAHEQGWRVYRPNSLLQTLGIYVLYFPSVVVVDSGAQIDWAQEAHLHLRSINAGPIVLLSGGAFDPRWDIMDSTSPEQHFVHSLPAANGRELITAITDWWNERSLQAHDPSNFVRTGIGRSRRCPDASEQRGRSGR